MNPTVSNRPTKRIKSLVHYRNVDDKYWLDVIAQRLYGHLKQYPPLRLTHGGKVLEIRPVIDWNKGRAVELLL
ncbi:unnamed protein product [Brassica rapa]|uniref:Uncharacterized protein n=1 Tax=Brassica campestris TaxID=3711 RepID=A0A3P5ZW62_BRACM|nr:unnamed protein product [Brassica rapa]VDC80945.1 unnamed protein product [Brassica rapa]